MRRLHLDIETFGCLDLEEVGAHLYGEHPATFIYVACWQLDSMPSRRWVWGDPIDGLRELALLLNCPDVILCAHNSAFERIVGSQCLTRQTGVRVAVPPERCDCTMARALALALPASLDKALKAAGLGVAKDMQGRATMLQLSKPRGKLGPDAKAALSSTAAAFAVPAEKWAEWLSAPPPYEVVTEYTTPTGKPRVKRQMVQDPPQIATWLDDGPKLMRVADYCAIDVLGEIALDGVLPPLSDREREIWHVDQHMNDRGVHVDLARVEKLRDMVAKEREYLNREMAEVTGGEVTSVTQRGRFQAWLNARGIFCDSLAEDKREAIWDLIRLRGDNAASVALQLYEEGSSTSVSKLDAMVAMADRWGRIRGNVQYHGAATGRWAGRGVQFQNVKRLDAEAARVLVMVLLAYERWGYDAARGLLASSQLRMIPLIAQTMRTNIVAPENTTLVAGDLSNIEGRINAWLWDEQWKVDAFRAYDTIIGFDAKGKPVRAGPDLYVLAYARAFNVSLEEALAHRQKGKVMELALGYQGGVGAFQTMAKTYRLFVSDLEAASLRDGWREAHPLIQRGWYALEEAAIRAVQNPGQWFPAANGKVSYVFRDRFLWCLLPSGRTLAYPYPKVVWKDKFGSVRPVLVTYTVKNGQWIERDLYGGLLDENVVQAIARDVIAEILLRAWRAGFDLRLSVHDEVIAIDPRDRARELEDLMSAPILWLAGCPLSAACWAAPSYVK
jgi:DNA polymerase